MISPQSCAHQNFVTLVTPVERFTDTSATCATSVSSRLQIATPRPVAVTLRVNEDGPGDGRVSHPEAAATSSRNPSIANVVWNCAGPRSQLVRIASANEAWSYWKSETLSKL